MSRSSRDGGFSLVEILVGLFVFALASTMAVAMLAVTVDGDAANADALERVDALDRVRVLLRDDLGQLVERPVRDENGFVRDYVFAGAEAGVPQRAGRRDDDRVVLSFTRRGRANPGLMHARSSLVHVEYRIRDDQLIRRVYGYPDAATDSQVQDRVLVADLDGFELEFFLANGWSREALLPLAQAGEGALPQAIRLGYTLAGFGDVEHLVLTPEAG